jgi:aryl-alcohol dehydrogenase-like predicted oxidoreductase
MFKRKLGSTGLEVSEVSFGAWQLGNFDDWGGMDDACAHRLVAEALEQGVNLFDTAPNYAATNSERLLGEALKGRRGDVVLVSKFGHTPAGPTDFSVKWFWQSLEATLKRLQTDYLDAYLLHNPHFEIYGGADPIWAALEEARAKGMIRHFGASLDQAHEIEACLNNTGSEVLEVFFNILHQDARRAFPLVREKGAGVIVKVPLDSGWLTGALNAESRFEGIRSRWSDEEIARRAGLVSQLDWLTDDGSTLAHRALGYLLSYEEVSCAIPGVRNSAQLCSNLEAAGNPLSLEEREKLESFWNEFTEGGEELLPW